MLTGLLIPDVRVTPLLFNAVIPGITLRNISRIRQLPSPRLIMTHSKWRRNIPRAVYLVRDGRDAIVSRFHYEVTRRGLAGQVDFPEFFERYAVSGYGETWHDNVKSWLGPGRAALGDRLLLVRFEDLKRETDVLLTEIADFLGIDCTEEAVSKAIRDSSIERMRKIEQQAKGELIDPNASFYRGGKSGTWKELLAGELRERFNAMSGEALQLAGYDI